MAIKIGDLLFEVTANTQGARASIESLGGAATEAGAIIASAIGGAVVTAATVAAGAVAKITYEVLQLGASFNTASQLSVGLFTALTGSVDEAIGLMREFNQLSLDTPIFNAKQLQGTTSLLLTFGIAKDDAFEMAQNIELASIALNRGTVGAHQLARAIGQIQGRGWLEGDEARQLSEVGVNAYAVIAEAIGKTTSEVMKMGRQHLLVAEEVIPILNAHLEETFGPVGQNLINTYTVQIQGLKNTLTGIGSALVQPFVGATGGGVIVEFLSKLREELDGVVTVGKDGTFQLSGAMAELNVVTEALAEGFAQLGDSFINWIASAGSGSGLSSLTEDIADAIPGIVMTIQDLASGTANFFSELGVALQPILPDLARFGAIILDLVQNGLPPLAAATVDLVGAAAILGHEFADVVLPVLEELVPVITDLFVALADIAEIIRELAPYVQDMIAIWIAWKAAIIIAEVATATFVQITLAPMVAMLLKVATAAGLALTALGLFKAAKAGIEGDRSFLVDEDIPFWMQPGQEVAKFAYRLGGGDKADEILANEKFIMQVDEARGAADDFNIAILDSAGTLKEAGVLARDYGEMLGFTGEQLEWFANRAVVLWDTTRDAEREAAEQAEETRRLLLAQQDAYVGMLIARGEQANGGLSAETLEEIDLLKELKNAADAAWESVDRLMMADAGATIDDFFRELPKLAQELTNALKMDGGVLRDLEVGGALSSARDKALDVIRTLAEEYGMSLDEIEAYFDERGLAGVIEAVGQMTKETTETVDPLIAKYGQLGGTVDQIRDALRKLNEERQTAIRSQIENVQTALEGAREAADRAREAILEFFSGGYVGGTQDLIDQLIGDIGNVGSDIEDALKMGGVQGEAAVRQALGGVQSQLADIVMAGLEEGMSGQQIVDMLGPLGTALAEQVSDARNRISSLDWEEGFTPKAATEISEMLGGVLDPAAIQSLISNVLGADRTVAGLERQLENLNAQLNTEVEFSQAQVQAAMDEIHATTEVEPLVTPEAAQMLFDEIQAIFDERDLEAAVDDAILAQSIWAAAKAAEDDDTLMFRAGVNFDATIIQEAARLLGPAFAAAFTDAVGDSFGQIQSGAASRNQLNAYLDFLEGRAATVGGPSVTTNIANDITIFESGDPRATASEVVGASSAASASGSYDPSKYFKPTYGVDVIPGLKGPQ